VLAAPVPLLVWLAWERRWMSDDGLINLRVVDQVMSGNGPVFNAGERVEAATSPLWIALLTAGDLLLPLRLEWVAVVLGIASTVVGVGAAITGSARLWEQAGGGVLVPLGALCLVVIPPVWDFSSSGLEGGLGLCWIGTSLLLLQRWASSGGRHVAAAAVVCGLGPVVRPDFVVLSGALLVALLVGERGTAVAHRLRLVALFAAVPLAYELFRMAYFGALVPNTYFAKEGGRANWEQGWWYLRDLVGPYRLWVPVAVLGATAIVPLVVLLHRQHERRAALVAAAFPVGGLLSALAIVRGGGDFMHARMLLPSLFAILAPVTAVALRRRTAWALAVVPWAAACLLAFDSPGSTPRHGIADHRAGLHELLGRDRLVTLDDFGYGPGGPNAFTFDDEHRLYADGRPLELGGRPVSLVPGAPDRVVIAYGVGAVGYYAGPDTHVVDMLGLGDALAARLWLDERGPLPGHEKGLPPAWVWARFIDPSVEPDPALLAPPAVLVEVSPTLAASREGDFAAEVEAARAALRCTELADLTESTQRTSAPAALADNAVNAIALFAFRVPPRPIDAHDHLC